jgi:hypothetical protein
MQSGDSVKIGANAANFFLRFINDEVIVVDLLNAGSRGIVAQSLLQIVRWIRAWPGSEKGEVHQ